MDEIFSLPFTWDSKNARVFSAFRGISGLSKDFKTVFVLLACIQNGGNSKISEFSVQGLEFLSR